MLTRLFVVLALPAVAFAAPNPKIAEARELFEDLDFEKAARTLAGAEVVSGNDRAQVLELLELQGLVYGTWNKEAKARDAFRELLTLNPDFKLGGEHPPRVRTPFYEAKGWVVDNAPLQVEPTAETGEKVTALVVTVKKDLLRLVKGVRFVVDEGAERGPRDVALTEGTARLGVDSGRVVWRVELIGQHESTLLELGPFTHQTGAAVAKSEPEPPAPEVKDRPSSGGWMKPTGYVLVGVGAAGVVVGAIFGVMSSDGRSRVTNAATSPAGLITSITQRDAATVEAQARQQALIANVALGVGGAFAAAGALLFFLSPSSAEPVSLLVGPSGFSVAGAWP